MGEGGRVLTIFIQIDKYMPASEIYVRLYMWTDWTGSKQGGWGRVMRSYNLPNIELIGIDRSINLIEKNPTNHATSIGTTFFCYILYKQICVLRYSLKGPGPSTVLEWNLYPLNKMALWDRVELHTSAKCHSQYESVCWLYLSQV